MKITLSYVIGRCSDTRNNAGCGSVGGLFQIFATPASRPAGVFAGNIVGRTENYCYKPAPLRFSPEKWYTIIHADSGKKQIGYNV